MATNVPQPVFGPTGFSVPTQQQILTGVIEDFQAAFGGNLNLNPNNSSSLTTPQGQLAVSTASIVGNAYELFQFYTQQTDPAYASGRMQDAIGRLYFLERLPALPTVLQVNCIGLAGVNIPAGALITDTSNNIYIAQTGGLIGSTGTATIAFSCTVPGPVVVPGTNQVSIYQAIPGWDSVSVVSGVEGQNVETRQQFELRRQQSVALNSVGSLTSMLGAALNVPGVVDAFVTENTTNGTLTVGGVVLSAHSVYAAVSGGSAAAVAQALWTKKAPGCAWGAGNTTVTVTDTNSGYSPPQPTYQVTFEIPPSLEIFFNVSLVSNSQVPANATQLVQAAVLNAFAGSDGGPRARIGSTLYASRFVGPVAAIGSWVQIRSITLGSVNSPTATFTGSIGSGGSAGGSGSVLTVTSISSGSLGVGNFLSDGTAGFISIGTTIVSQLTGVSGGTGTYSINLPQLVTTETMYTVNANLTALVVNANQEPICGSAAITVSTS